MATSEFDLIEQYFAAQPGTRSDVVLGIGDDCALLQVPPGETLAVTLDTLVADVHFATVTDPVAIGHKALAVNLSDLAAMGASPAWITLALSLPNVEADWLAGFCRGLFGLAKQHQVQLVGGDVTRGPLTITIQAHGFLPADAALRRDGAQPGDIICVTGTLGDAALGLAASQGKAHPAEPHHSYLRQRLERPTPRIAQGLALRGLASAAIDISDGLAQDLGHILTRSHAGAELQVARLPRSAALRACLDEDQAIALVLSGGDDYELCFTVPPASLNRLRSLAAGWDCGYSEIGAVETRPGLRYRHADGSIFSLSNRGYDHFA